MFSPSMRNALETAIETSVKAKAAIVARDEHETGDRALLNLGHTLRPRPRSLDRLFGSPAAWRRRRHRRVPGLPLFGGAGPLPGRNGRARHATISKRSACPWPSTTFRAARADAGELVRLMGQDKKVRDGQLTFILVRGIGEAFVSRDVEQAKVLAFLEREIARA